MTEAAATATDAHAPTLATLTAHPRRGGLHDLRFRDNLRVYLPPERLIPALTALQDECGFASSRSRRDRLSRLSGARRAARFEVHYVLLNRDTHERLVVKAGVDDPEPTLPSAVPLWLGADWMEREVFDMYGIRFAGHPDLRRILMPEEFAAFPLRKDYPLRGRGERHNFPRLTRDES